MKSYRRSTGIEPLRRLCRAIDLLFLLRRLSTSGRLPPLSNLREMVLIEMGPGPMRLAALKRKLFRQVYFLDISDFGVPDPGLIIVNLENCASVQSVIECLPQSARSGPVLLFADHCLEHISPQVLTGLLDSIAAAGLGACFRVPNMFSAAGWQSYIRDATHRTPFDDQFRRNRENAGFLIFPWIRWYRPLKLYQRLTGGGSAMDVAEEIVLSSQHTLA